MNRYKVTVNGTAYDVLVEDMGAAQASYAPVAQPAPASPWVRASTVCRIPAPKWPRAACSGPTADARTRPLPLSATACAAKRATPLSGAAPQ